MHAAKLPRAAKSVRAVATRCTRSLYNSYHFRQRRDDDPSPYNNHQPCPYHLCSHKDKVRLSSFSFIRQIARGCAVQVDSSKTEDNEVAIQIAHVINKNQWWPLSEKELQDFLPLLSSTVHAVLNMDIPLRPALAFLSWASKQPGLVLNADDVHEIGHLWAFRKYRDSFTLTVLQETFASMGYQYTEATWAAMMTTSSLLRRPEESITIFMEMRKFGCKPTQLSYDPFLYALVKCGRLDAALLATQEMLGYGILPGERILGVLLDSLGKTNRSEKAYNLLQAIGQLSPVSYLEFAYSRFITAVWRLRGSLALDLYNEMIQKDLKPDKQAGAVCVKLLCRNQRYDLAQTLLNDMNEPNVLAYSELINSLFRGGRAKEALQLIELLKNQGHPLDSRLYTTNLTCLFMVGRIKDAIEVFELMQRDGTPAAHMQYYVMIKNLCENGDVMRALELKKVMEEKGTQPDAQVYLALQRGLCAGSCNVEALLNLVEEMKMKGALPAAEVYYTLITHFCTLRDFNSACMWAKEMNSQGYQATPYIRSRFRELGDAL